MSLYCRYFICIYAHLLLGGWKALVKQLRLKGYPPKICLIIIINNNSNYNNKNNNNNNRVARIVTA